MRSWTWALTGFVQALLAVALWWALRTDLTVLGHIPSTQGLDWRPQLAWSEPWRLWTAALVHWSGNHLSANLVGCVAVIAWGHAFGAKARHTLAWLLAWPLTHALLATDPTLLRFGGLSGLLHAGVAIGALTLAWHGPGNRRTIGLIVLVGLVVKLALESPTLGHWIGLGASPQPLTGAPEFTVAGYAHFTGTVAGLACAALVEGVAHLAPGKVKPK